METSKKDGELRIQTLPITLGGLFASAISGIVGYIAVYFFKPLWEKIIKLWEK